MKQQRQFPLTGQLGRELVIAETQHMALGGFTGFVFRTMDEVLYLLGPIWLKIPNRHLADRVEQGGGKYLPRHHVCPQPGPGFGVMGRMKGSAISSRQSRLITLQRIDEGERFGNRLDSVQSKHHHRMFHRGNRHAKVAVMKAIGAAEQVTGETGIAVDHVGEVSERIELFKEELQVVNGLLHRRQQSVPNPLSNPFFWISTHEIVSPSP